MSNVLIGIIGVILFIGLALAGALFLGPRFQEASTNSKVAAAVQAVSQTTNAIRMYEVQEGERVTLSSMGNTLDTPTEENRIQLVDGGYLKAIPANPLNSGGIYIANIIWTIRRPSILAI